MSTSPFRKILFAVRAEDLDGGWLDGAARLVAALRPAEVHAITVLPAGGRERDVAAGLARALPTARVVTAQGPPIDAILRHAASELIDLVVLGHRHGARSAALARRLARHAPCSVWMVPDGAPLVPRRLVVAVDFSPTSGAALDAALALCRALGLPECPVVSVYDTIEPEERGPASRVAATERADFESLMKQRDPGGVVVRPVFESAVDVASGVGRVAHRESADLIVLGSRGRSTATAVLLGSATEDVMDRAHCGVLVVRAAGGRPSFFETLVRRIFTEDDRPQCR